MNDPIRTAHRTEPRPTRLDGARRRAEAARSGAARLFWALALSLLTALAGAWSPSEVAAQAAQGAVTGRVVDAESGSPLAGARVTLVETGRFATTDEDGRFRIANVAPGTYRLQVQTISYRTAEQTVQVREGETVEVDVGLTLQPVRLRELVISPRRVVETAREAPLTVTAFDAQEIRDAEINRPKEMLQLTPGATLVRSVDSGCCAFITVRGIGQQRNTETPVATVVDRVQQFSPLQFDQPLYDVERIEVVKGPEGALYGRNAIAGAILIQTREPTPEPEGFLRVGAGQGERVEVTGAYGGPIVGDELLFRVAGHFRNQRGFYDNITLDRKADGLKAANARVKLRWNASDRLQVDLKGQIDRTESNSLALFHYQPAILGPDGRSLSDAEFPFDFERIDSNDVRRFSTANNLGIDERRIDELSGRLRYGGGFGDVELITSYTNIGNLRIGDQFPYTAITSRTIEGFGTIDGTQTQWKDVEGWRTELRVRSPEDQRVRWQFGGDYLSWDRFISATVGEDRGNGILVLRREPAFESTTNPTLSWLADDNDNLAWALFGNLEFDLAPHLTVMGALRYDRELRDQFVHPDNTAGAPGALNEATFDKAQPKVRLRYARELASDVLNFVNLYGSWGIGFRSGQFNQNGVAEAAAAAGLEGVEDVIPQEEASSFEAGFKSRWLDDRVSWESAFYKTDDEGQPFFLFIGQVGAQVLVGIPEADITGFESTLRAKVARGLDLYAAGAITDTEIQAFPVDPDAVGGHIPLVPTHTLNLGAQYRAELADDVALITRLDFERLGEMAWTAANTTPRDPVNLLGLKGGLEVSGWMARFEISNLTDEEFNGEFVAGGFAWPAPPRRWRVTLERAFPGN